MGDLSYGVNGSSYYDLCRQGRVFSAFASVTSPVVYSTAAGTGGPLLWNNTGATNRVLAVILAVSAGWTTAPGATGVLGVTGNSGQTAAPTTTTAITASANMYLGLGAPTCNLYNIGTVANAGNFFMPTHSMSTAATPSDPTWQAIDGALIVPPGSWCAAAGAATLTTMVGKIGLLWAEIPY